MTDPSPDCGYTEAYVAALEQAWDEILRLREFGEHYSGAAQDAWDRIEVLEKALREILLIAAPAWTECPAKDGWHEPYGTIAGITEGALRESYKDALAAAAPVSTEPPP